MDINKLAGSLLSSDSISGLSNLTGASNKDVTNVLTQAIPSLLNGAKDQAKGDNTSASFVTALTDHAKVDTSDLTKFLGNVDMKDGAKIIGHLLGSDKDDVVSDIAKDTGVSKSKTNSILSSAAPLLMSLLGQQAQEEEKDESVMGNLVGTILSNVDIGSLVGGLLTSNSGNSEEEESESEEKDKKKKKKKTKKDEEKEEEKEESGNIINTLFNLLK